MSTFSQALTGLIDARYDKAMEFHRKFPVGIPDTRDEIAVGDKGVRIGYEVFGETGLLDAFWDERDLLDFGTFDNCREYGLTVTVGGWTFCAYEHRNSDDICLEGCPTGEVKEYGPYGEDNKYDVLFSARWKHYSDVADAVVAAARYVLDHPNADRQDVKAAIIAARATVVQA